MSTVNNTNTNLKNIVVIGQIADASGHTDFKGSLEEAVDLIMEQVQNAGKWVFVNGNPFMFELFDNDEKTQFSNALAESPSFVLTAKLQGGAKPQHALNKKAVVAKKPAVKPNARYIGNIVKQPLSVAAKDTVFHLGVSVTSKDGSDLVKVIISDYNGARAKLQKHENQILAAIYKGLRPTVELKAEAADQA